MKAFVALALLCLAGSAMAQNRGLLEGETDLVALASTALLESGSALTAEESMLLASGAYGNAPSSMAGGYGGILFDNTGLEAGSSTTPAPATPAAPAPAAATTAKSAALPLDRSAALFAGAAVALSAFLL